jgi:hypothetical protein
MGQIEKQGSTQKTVWGWVAAAAFTLIATIAFDALALGSARLKSSEVQEVSGAWHLFVTIELPKPPLTPHQPMRFVFTKTAVYERALTDNSKEPVLNRQALQNQLPQAESLDVDFSNSSGKIFKVTNFDFGLTRARGYEAGEYTLQIRTADGIDIGNAIKLTLKGDNPVVDRRSITFDPKKPKKVGDDTDAGAKTTNNASDFVPPSQEVTPAGSATPFIPKEAYNPTEEEKVKEKPGGCGCSVPGMSDMPSWPYAASAVGLGVALACFRRRRDPAR